MAGRWVLAVSCALGVGCAVPRQMLAPSDDYADYRAFRMASQEGTRLARAQHYLRRHPQGVWADELRQVFETEEAAWFEVAKSSRARARDYIVDLPRGPHIQAARALLAMFDDRETDIDMLELLAASRRTEAMLDLESERRRRVGEVVLEELAALIAPETMGASLDDPPHALAVVLRGAVPRTWGATPNGLRQDDLYFVLPTPRETEACVAQVTFRLKLEGGRVVGGNIEGEDLFLRWAEANALRVLDPTVAEDRAAAAGDAIDVLAGALEARFPASRCAVEPKRQNGEILARSCDGWRVTIRTGARSGDHDVVEVRGRSS